MTRENFLWGAPRIHGELLMLGFSVSQATVSRYMPARSRRPEQLWRTFLRNQAMAFGRGKYFAEAPRGDTIAHIELCRAQMKLSGVVAPQPTVNVGRFGLHVSQRDRGVTHRFASMSGGTIRALCSRRDAIFLIRSPPH